MLQNIIGRFCLMVICIIIINVGIWASREMNNLKYDKNAKKDVLLMTCIIGLIYFIVSIAEDATGALSSP